VIKRLHIKNYKALRDVTVELTPIHALIGPNDAGKTSILQALYAICQSVDHNIHDSFPGLWNGRDLVWNEATDREIEISVTVGLATEDVCYSIRCGFPATGRDMRLVHEGVTRNGTAAALSPHAIQSLLFRLGESQAPEVPTEVGSEIAQGLRLALRGVHWHRWDPRFLALPNALDTRWRYRLEPTGFGLVRCLDDILGYDRSLFAELEQRFIQLFPEFRGIILQPQKAYLSNDIPTIGLPRLEERDGKGLAFHLAKGGEPLPAAQVSDGVLLVLAYLTILHLPEPPRLLLVEEPENGIHPERLEKIIAVLREVIDRRRHTQIVMTTHSPYMVDLLKPEEVTLCCKGRDGAVNTRRLSDIPRVQQQLDLFRLGEIWTGEGDEALAGEPPLATGSP